MHPDRQQRPPRRTHVTVLATLAISGVISPVAHAAAGIDVSANGAVEEYTYPRGSKTVDSQKITLTPWWSNDDWRLSAAIPFINRHMEAQGTVPVCTSWNFLLRRCATWGTAQLNVSEDDAGIGDVWLHATRTWAVTEHVDTYVGGHLRVPTGDEGSPGTATLGTRYATRSGGFNDFTLGKDGTDFRLAPGVTVYNDYLWGTVEPAYTWTNSTGEENRAGAYAGVGVTPWRYLEASIGFDYEDEISPGSGTLEQVTYAVTLRPNKSLAITASMYDDDDPSSPDSNWTIGVSSHW